MGAVFHALEVHHAIEASERCAVALISVAVKLLLGEDIAAALRWVVSRHSRRCLHGVVNKRGTYFAGEGDHADGAVCGQQEARRIEKVVAAGFRRIIVYSV